MNVLYSSSEELYQDRSSRLFFSFLSLALNKSCDVRNTSQLFIFVRGIMKEFEIMEALTAMHSVKGTTTGSDLFTKVSALMGLG